MSLELIGSVGWDAGSVIMGAPENLYVFNDWLVKNQKPDKDDFDNQFSQRIIMGEYRDELCKYGIAFFDGFGGDGMGNLYGQGEVIAKNKKGKLSQRQPKLIGSQFQNGSKDKVIYRSLTFEFGEIPEDGTPDIHKSSCKITWSDGLLYFGDPIAFDSILEKYPTYVDFKKMYQNKGKSQFFLTEILIDELPQTGAFKIFTLDYSGNGSDDLIQFDPI
jgi:hypothetical protein